MQRQGEKRQHRMSTQQPAVQGQSRECMRKGDKCACGERLRPDLDGTCLSRKRLALILEATERSLLLVKTKGKLHDQLPVGKAPLKTL